MVNLKPLKELTQELSDLVTNPNNNFIRYDVEGGECFGFNLYHIPKIALQRSFMSKGTEFLRHIHKDEIEIIVIYDGKLKGIINGKEETYEVGGCIRIDKSIPHSWEAIEDTWMIAITIPASEAYP